MENGFEIAIPGFSDFTIKSNTIYTVMPKPDPNAPDGYREHGTTKLIHPDITNTVAAPFDTAMNVWDTGFYEGSACLRGLSPEERKKHVENVTKNIVNPVEEILGEGRLSHRHTNDFFDEFPIALYNKVSFNTEDPVQLLMLYLAVVGKELAPKEYVGNPNFKQAAYQVVNRESEVSNKQQIKIDKSKAIGKFHSLLATDKDKLSIILSYLNISNAAIKNEDTFISVFDRFLEDKQDGYRNSNIFLETVDKFTGDGEEELYIFEALSELADKNELRVYKQEYFLGEEKLGNSIKHAAAYVAQRPELIQKVMKVKVEDEETEE